MPTEEHKPARSHPDILQGVLALARMHPLRILAATVGAALLVWVLLFVYLSSPAWAATITVNSTADPGTDDAQCTLREAITSANTDTAIGGCLTGSGNDVINIGVTGTVNLTTELPALASNMEIVGPGASQFAVTRPDTAENFRIFTVIGDTTVVTISGMTISGGNVSLGFRGGGILIADSATLTITDSTISGNSAGNDGGGISNGNLNNGGTLTITDSTISGNTAQQGGAIFNDEGTLKITDSTISDNSARAGGGVFSRTELPDTDPANDPDVKTTITNSTLSGNTALVTGGGVINFDGLTVIEHSTITNNTAPNGAGSGVRSGGSTSTSTEVLSTIISANPGTDVDAGQPNNTFVSNGYNLIGDGNATGAFNQTGDQVIGDDPPGLGPLTDNGGPTQTHALLTGSPAIDKGNSFGVTTDQRGESRPHDFPDIANATGGDGSDIGSFELQSQPALSIDNVTVTEGNSGTTTATFTVSLSKASSQTVTVNYATADGTATAGTDFQSSSGTLTFAPGQTTQSVPVQVNGESVPEEDESFFVNLSNPTNATISDAQGKGTITNDDRPPDTTAPRVISTFPRNGGEVGPAANIRATFSEEMREASVINAFKLFKKGSTNQIAATVTYDAATDTATLNPTNNLRRGANYKAVVTTVAKDEAGNRLDQNSSKSGSQRKVWFFEIDN